MTSYEVFNSIQIDCKQAQHDYDCIGDCIEASSPEEAISMAQDIICAAAHAEGHQAVVIDDGMIRIIPDKNSGDEPFVCFNFHVL